jgi:hypothetical protein
LKESDKSKGRSTPAKSKATSAASPLYPPPPPLPPSTENLTDTAKSIQSDTEDFVTPSGVKVCHECKGLDGHLTTCSIYKKQKTEKMAPLPSTYISIIGDSGANL